MSELIEKEIYGYFVKLNTERGSRYCFISADGGDIESIEELLGAFRIEPESTIKKRFEIYIKEVFV